MLALDHAESFAREDFLSGPSNAAALALIDRWPDWPNRVMALVGPEGSGKSHLASIWAEPMPAPARLAAQLLLANRSARSALPPARWCLRILKRRGLDERALFHLLNLAREEARLSAAHRARRARRSSGRPSAISASRLRALPGVALAPPDDALLRALIVKLAADRQLMFDEALVDYLANRIERSFAAARSAVARLDEEAMRQHRPVTQVTCRRTVPRHPPLDGEAPHGRRTVIRTPR